jgi:SPP1 gp7 family putative phage head morphogenesis protein
LRTEYDTAIASAQMASKWVDIKADKDILPLLQYDAVIDGRTSDICIDFNEIIRPVDDGFWDQFYPPNHFGCRSTVRQLSEGEPTNINNLAVPEKIPEMFKVNLGKRGLAFPPGHSYYIGTPQEALDALL